ncbi:MAG TPA: hypothetical protein VIF62_23705 [Labilithrix sp.]
MAYRDAKAPPIVTYLGGVLVAADAETGERVWTRPLGTPVLRMVLAWRHVFVAVPSVSRPEISDVVWFDVHTGDKRGELDAGFRITAALARGTHVYFGGEEASIALSADGTLLFTIRVETVTQGFLSNETNLVARDAAGREMWREKTTSSHGAGVLLLGDAVAQPDFDS